MSEVKVNKISPRSGTTVTLGDSGDTIAVASGASLSGFTSTGIDDNASSTAVTILSSGFVGVGQTNPTTNFHVGDDSAGSENTSIRIEGGSTSGYSQVHFADSGDVNVGRVQYTHSSNTMALYTNDTERMRIDSSGRVGIDETDNSTYVLGKKLVVGDLDNNDGLTLKAIDSTDTNYLAFADTDNGAGSYAGFAGYSHNDNSFRIGTSSLERMRIDSSGNVLVGKTTTDFGTAGSKFQSNGQVALTASANEPLVLNRLSSNGYAQIIYQGGTQIGALITQPSTTMSIDGGNSSTQRSGIKFLENEIRPRKGINDSDNVVDLGNGSNRWNDLYLGGNIYLGGTGSANALDDYEKGTWTPRILFGGADTGNTYGAQDGTYVKVGNLITAGFFINVSSKGSATGTASISGLPFNAGGSGDRWGGTLSYYAGLSSVSGSPNLLIEPNGTSGALRKDGSTDLSNSNFNSGFSIYGVYIYTDQ